MPDVKRSYDSSRRRRQAAATSERLASAARHLFVRHGYAATTVAMIAEEAGTAVPTFYAMYGSKRNVMLALLGAMESDAEAQTALQQLANERDPRAQLRLLIAFHVRLFARGADLMRVLRAAGSADPDLAAAWAEGESRRLSTEAPLVRRWARRRSLRRGLAEKEALDILWTMTGPDVFVLFTEKRQWTPQRLTEWLDQTLAQALFSARMPVAR